MALHKKTHSAINNRIDYKQEISISELHPMVTMMHFTWNKKDTNKD